LARTPASPTTPMAMPAAREARPQACAGCGGGRGRLSLQAGTGRRAPRVRGRAAGPGRCVGMREGRASWRATALPGAARAVSARARGHADRGTHETSAETSVAVVEVEGLGGGLVDPRRDNDGNDKAVDTKDTGHNDGHNGLHHQLRAHNTHGGDADARLGSAVRCAIRGGQSTGQLHARAPGCPPSGAAGGSTPVRQDRWANGGR